MSHALFVGGTGMLKGAVLYFARHAYCVSVIARGQSGLDNMILEKQDTGFINPLRVDYSNSQKLREKITESASEFGNFDLCIAWIHHHASEAALVIAEILNRGQIPVRFFHVLGCEFESPFKSNINIEKKFEKYEFLLYRKVILGFVNEDESSRWLTNEEISNGVIDAVNTDTETYIVGSVSPWESRPKF